MVGVGLALDGVTATWCFMTSFLVLWPITLGITATVRDRYELRVTPGDLVLRQWRWGRPSRQRLELVGATVRGDVTELSRGGVVVVLVVTDAGGRALRVALPGTTDARARAEVVEHARWLERTIAELASRAEPPPDDPVARAAVDRLGSEIG